ncbi:beta-lactamase family protein, partial [Candidatus Acetothermia bacterium]|nr:beta-lactamase family protein [Candidatus Acetothermia bacterium]
SIVTWSQTQPENLDALLEPIRSSSGIPALAGAFVQGKDLIGLGAVGTRKLGGTERVQPNDRFHLGSDTKSMTATLLGMLVEQGKLTWETTIVEIFPDLKDKIRPEFHKLTPIHLLSHRAGIPGQATPGPYGRLHDQLWNLRGPLPEQRRAVIELVLSQPPVSEPGSMYNYSNHGFIIAGAWAEQLTGKPWEELMQQMLFKSLDMKIVGFGAPGTPGTVDQPWGHLNCVPVAPDSRNPPSDNPPVLGPAGTVHSAMSDWASYASLHLLGAQGQPGLLLKPETFQQLHKDWYQQGYALGWIVIERSWAGGRALTHAGSNTYWYANIWIAPQRNAAFLAATNVANCPAQDSGFRATDAVIGALIRKYL